MREAPSPELVSLLARLSLADEGQILAVRRAARRLARDLPLFDSVWIERWLVQTGRLTPFQAEWINAGRGAELRIGPYVLVSLERRLGYAIWYRARNIQDREDQASQEVRLVVCASDQVTSDDAHRRLSSVAEISLPRTIVRFRRSSKRA